MRKFLVLLALLFLQPAVNAQKKGQAKIDSLVQVLQTAKQDTARVRKLNLLGSEWLRMGKPDSAIALFSSALNLSERLSFARGEADAYFFIGQALVAKAKNSEALINYEKALKLYQQIRYPVEEAEAYYAMGRVYQRSNYDLALEFLKKALQVAQQTSNKNVMGKAAYTTAVTLQRKGDYDESQRYNDLAIKYYSESGNETGLADCYVASARIHNRRGNFQQSLKDNYAALRLFEKTGNKVGMYNVHTGIGLMYEDQKNYPEALTSYQAAKKAAEEHGNKEVLCGAYNNLGNAYRELGDMIEAHKAFTEALKLGEEAGYKKGLATAQGNLGTIYSLTGRPTEALKSYEQARKLFEQLGARESESISYLEAGQVYLDMKKPEESKQSLEKALQIAKQVGYKDVISKSYLLLTQIDTASGNYVSAFDHYKLYITYRDSIANAEAARQLIEQRMQYAFSKKEDSLQVQQALIAEKLEKQTLLSKQQQQELRLKQASLELAKREKDVQMLTFLKTKAELQLSNEQKERKLTLAGQEKALQQSRLEKQTLLSTQKEQALLLKDKELTAQRSQRNFWLAGAIALLLFSFFIFHNYQQKQKANRLLRNKNLALEDQRDQTNKALSELQQTQLQLIQKEKMASLGELTAGIAHEIQNPLNFVNNFSESSDELLKEMEEALQNGRYAEASVIIGDVRQNLQKITHHGKRAGSIIRDMLQHSRKSDGVKVPTDLNALVDEYLRLSYHSFRTKEKAFAITLETYFDKAVGQVNIVPQDLSRVLLNLFNNAFYAVHEQKKQLKGSYEPTVSVSTKREGDNIIIRVKDNGTGISEKLAGKVFQPFFTTKPTGEGTGLGLSLSYDVVTKSHGGDLKVASKEGEGAEFTIQLPA